MSIITRMTIQRLGKTIDQGVPCQLDNLSPKEVADEGGESPYDSYTLLTLGDVADIRRQDLLIDEGTGPQNSNPDTGNPMQYRVFGKPEHFTVMAHTEANVELFIGGN